MIISKTIKVGIGSIKTCYKPKYNLKPKEKVNIPIEHLLEKSSLKIEVECDICKNNLFKNLWL